MSRIAVDAVLLPSEEVQAKAIEANRELLKQCPDRIVLDKENCLPHVSLAMGCIDERDVVSVAGIFQAVVENRPLEHLISIGINVGTNAVGEKVSVLELERTAALQSLHEELMRRLSPHFSHDVTAEMLFSPPPVCESTLLWIRDYPEKSSFERFFPHITLGYGQLDDFSFAPGFTASTLALCHLGNHCTCRRILTCREFPR
ncbi:MAG: hypothetical protein ACYSWO_01195 [Planctomycetota bacterium]|jgi:hypothetical protein